jgi:signal peptidase I
MNEKPRRWWVSLLLSLLLPGLGQIYNGQAVKGFIFLFIIEIFIPLIFFQILAFHPSNLPILTFFLLTILISVVFYIAVIVDAVRQSRKLSINYQLK